MSSLTDFGVAPKTKLLPARIRQAASGPECPECGRPVAQSKGTQEVVGANIVSPAVEEATGTNLITHGWVCQSHAAPLVMPTKCGGPDASRFGDGWVGVLVEFDDGKSRFLPVPRREVDEGVNLHAQEVASDGGANVPDGPTRVGEWFGDDCDVYIGRAGDDGDKHILNTPVGERGGLGNPYPVGPDAYGREESVARFARDLLALVDDDPEFRRDLYLTCKGRVLGCYCQALDDDGPLCHGEVIARVVDGMKPPAAGGEGGVGQ